MIISFGNKINSVRYKSWLAVSILVLSTLFTGIGAFFPTQTANAQSVDNFEPGIQKALYKYALATCLGYSHLRDDKAFGDTKSNIDEQSARNYEWFNDTPAIGTTKTTLDVFGGIGISKFGGSGVDDYGRAQCSNTAFIASAVKAIGYNAPSGDANTVFQVLCDFGFRRSGGDGCLSGNGSWDRRNLGSEDAARDAFLNSPKAKAVPDLTPAQLYWLGLNTFVTACNATITPPGGANVSEGTVKIKTYNKDTASMVESTAAWGPNKKSYSISGTSADMYTVGVISPRSTNYAPNIISAGQVLQTSVRIGNQINGCVDFAKWVNQYADAYAAWRIENPDFVGSTDPLLGCSADAAGCDSPTTCVIEAVGWIVCPVMNFTAGIVDAAYSFVTALLKVQPLLTTGGTAGIYNAWVVMRNIANIAFVIVFLFIIFSQLTSMGVSNYGVKKLLPRLVIAAILVNVSFWICAIAVDLSNIIGSSMLQVFQVVEVAIPNEASTGIGGSGDGWQGIVGGLLAGTIAAGTIYYVGLSALIPALLAALVAIITVFLVLTLRQALIILLIVIAPLAFVAYLLPNTEGWFTKWRKLLMTLLLMYPIIALIFGASALASQIVMSTAGGNIVIQIMGACIAIVPLALTPLVMKTAGGLLNRFGGIVNNAEKGPIDRLRKTGEKYREGRVNLRNSRALSGEKQLGRSSFIKWRARRGAIANGRQSEANRANTEYVADTIQANEMFQNSVAGGTGINPATSEAQQRALASAISTKSKLQSDELSSAQIVVKSAQLDQNEIRALSEGLQVEKNGVKLDGNSTAIKAAAVRNVVESNDVFQINKLWDISRTWHGEEGNKLREVFADSLQSSSGRPAYIGQGAIAGLRSSTAENPHGDHVSVIEGAMKANAYSPEKIVTADKDELAAVDQVRRSSTKISTESHTQFNTNITKALGDDKLNVRIGKNRENITKIQANIPIDHLK